MSSSVSARYVSGGGLPPKTPNLHPPPKKKNSCRPQFLEKVILCCKEETVHTRCGFWVSN